MPTVNTDFERIDQLIDEFDRRVSELAARLVEECKKVHEAAQVVGESWSGSCFGAHALLYYDEFKKPSIDALFNVEWGLNFGMPHGWSERSVTDIESEIERLSGVTPASFKDAVKAFAEFATAVRDDVSLELASLPSDQAVAERTLISSIESTTWDNEISNRYVVDAINACPRVTRDFAAINAGRHTPVHAFYEGLANQARGYVNTAKSFSLNVRKLLKRIQARSLNPNRREKQGQDSSAPQSQVFNLHGANARINIQSSDSSTNIVSGEAEQLFALLRSAVRDTKLIQKEKEELILEIGRLEASHKTGGFIAGYQHFMSVAADHLTIFLPYLPALSKLLGG